MSRSEEDIIQRLKENARNELTENILPFWTERMPDRKQGGFYGRVDGKNTVHPDAPKGAVLNARILWAFSSAHHILETPSYLETATLAWEYANRYFFDEEYGGVWWSLNCNGTPLETKKQVYAQAFFIYALSRYFITTGDDNARKRAVVLYELLEEHSLDRQYGGYLEAFSREWKEMEDLRLSKKDENEKKTTNTNLHVLEAYTLLSRIWPVRYLRSQLRSLLRSFLEKIIHPETFHLRLFFDEFWNPRSQLVSYGHDIEAAWLLYEAALMVEDSSLTRRVAEISVKMVDAALEGFQDDGSLIYEKDDSKGYIDRDRHWWVQAEAVVGLIHAWQLTKRKDYLQKADRCFNYITNHLADRKNGEWYWSIRADGTANTHDDKAGFWKCPYHNSRMCLEIMQRFGNK
ncbi:MAG TPA: N-acyl-D-glucosamine 2-epimerase [Bacteroidetes bacterium]|nr:N-acyl-D-glucosamine 2-epimerase [Bacteroidota bacterium]